MDEFFDDMKPGITGHILIREKETGEILLNKRDSNNKQIKINPLSKYNDIREDEDERSDEQ